MEDEFDGSVSSPSDGLGLQAGHCDIIEASQHVDNSGSSHNVVVTNSVNLNILKPFLIVQDLLNEIDVEAQWSPLAD